MEECIKIDDYVRNGMVIFGKEVNNNRQLAMITDGLKPVFRRVIYVTSKVAATKTLKTSAISGNTIATVHPHSSTSVDNVISSLVRWGILEGQGNFGMKMIYGDDIPASAPRYTEAKMAEQWYNIIKDLMPYVPYKEAELEGNLEPEYIPTPVPFILMFSGMGIGYGANSRYPMFTAKSMYEALKNNNPSLLEAPSGLILDKSTSELNDLWNKGLGRITYRYTLTKEYISSGDGCMIHGSAEIFKPLLDSAFEDELWSGRVYILDQTSGDIPSVFVGRSPNVRAIDQDEIYNRCVDACKYTRMFRLTVTDGDSSFLIPMREWLRYTYDNYISIVEKYRLDKISTLEFDYKVFDNLKSVAECLMNHRDYSAEDISKELNCELDVVKSILRKSIGTLKNTDSTAKLKDITNQINQFKELNPEEYTDKLIESIP